MKIPSDAIIPLEKITEYLLVPREWDDKSKFLPNGRGLQVVTIWLRWHVDGQVRFVTLKPRKEKKS
jgi:hypothetical protein